MLDNLQATFGTRELPTVAEAIGLERLSFVIGETGVRAIAWDGVELVRSIDYPIRDGAWGTFPTRTIDAASSDRDDGFYYRRTFECEGGSVAGVFELTAETAGRMTLQLELTVRRDICLCRAGFTLLHPLKGLAGGLLTIIEPDGRSRKARFPLLIAPAQPATDIIGMGYEIDGCAVAIAMMGEVFEMEDQRNWSDASYKTYGRTASFPLAYQARAGEQVRQTLTLTFSGTCDTVQAASARPLQLGRLAEAGIFPELAIAVEAGWNADELPPPLAGLRRIVRLDLRDPNELTGLGGAARPPLDLELIVPDDQDALLSALQGVKQALATIGVVPEHIMALPAAYLKSYQPDGKWPTGVTPAAAAAAARRVFPTSLIGGGMLTNFTEFNRCPPDPAAIDYVTHGSTATIHAADDLSVFQTLEALPHIFDSAHALAPGKPYRLGLVAIAARTNPYGARLKPNPDGCRLTLTDQDPRTGSLFGAAWLVGVAAATLGADIELLTLAGAGGPFGLVGPDGRLAPGFHVLGQLSAMQGKPRLHPSGGDQALHVVAVAAGEGAVAIVANGSAEPRQLQMPGAWRATVLDAQSVGAAATDTDWVDRTLVMGSGALSMAPYALAFVEVDTLQEDQA